MEKRVREKTCPVDGRRDARTVEAINAALVDKLAGMFLFFKEADEENDVGDDDSEPYSKKKMLIVNRSNDRVHILSEEVERVRDLRIGESPRRVKQMRKADFTVERRKEVWWLISLEELKDIDPR